MQTLFEWDFGDKSDKEAHEILARNVAEFASGMSDTSFVEDLLGGVLKKRATLDEVIEKAAPEWPIDKISIVDRNVLRIGLYELLFGDKKDVPAKVAINEAIELAKTFSGHNSGKFVNGVLGSVYRELGEPGKDEVSKRKRNQNLDPAKMILENLGGAVVFSRTDEGVQLALVHDIFGYWTLSKGKMEGDEDVAKATIREIKEEMGVDIDIKEELGSNEYIASDPERGKIRKRVTYFVAEAPHQDLVLGESGGLDDVRWFPLDALPDLRMYDDILPIVTKGIEYIMKE